MAATQDVYKTRMTIKFIKGSKSFNNIKVGATPDDIYATFDAIQKLYKATSTGCEVTSYAKIMSA